MKPVKKPDPQVKFNFIFIFLNMTFIHSFIVIKGELKMYTLSVSDNRLTNK